MAKFTAAITHLLSVARLAPSSHNTQPWKVAVDITTKTVSIGYEPARQLLVGDPEKRELYLSLGCFTESLVLAASQAGFAVKVDYRDRAPNEVVRLKFSDVAPDPEPWESLIRHRRSDRRHYQPQPLKTVASQELLSLHQGVASLSLFSQPTEINSVAQATYDATFTAMSNPAFRNELSNWVRHNWTKRPDGMPAYVQGIPGPLSLIAKTVIRKNKAVAKDQAKKDKGRISHSGAIGLITTPEQTPKAWLDAGRLYQRTCLVAEKHGVKTAALSAAIIDPATTKQLMRSLALPQTPVALLRFGYINGKAAKASPRLAVSQFASGL